MLGASINPAAAAAMAPATGAAAPPSTNTPAPFSRRLSDEAARATVNALVPMLGTCSIDCSNVNLEQGPWYDIPYPGMVDVFGFLVPIASFKGLPTIVQTYTDAQMPKGLDFLKKYGWIPKSQERLAQTIDQFRKDVGNQVYNAHWDGIQYVGTLTGRALDPAQAPDPASTMSLKGALAKFPEFSIVYKDIPALAPLTAEYTQPGGFAAYLKRGGWLWSSLALSGQLPLQRTGVRGCVQWCNSGCKSTTWPNGKPVCAQFVDFDHDADGNNLNWDVYASRENGMKTTLRLVPAFAGGLEKALETVGRALDKLIPVACALVSAAPSTPDYAAVKPIAQQACKVAGSPTTDALVVLPVTPLPTGPGTVAPPPPPITAKPWYAYPGVWLVGAAAAAGGVALYVKHRR
jgi:hypothetical protein